jgi:exodeoxyribonuclease-5
MTLELTPHQEDCLDQLLDLPGQVVALRGLAGTGKTSMIPHIAEEIPAAVICAPTNRAAIVLQKKGINATTLHAACLRPHYTEEFESFANWVENPNSKSIPALIHKVPPDEAIIKVNQAHQNLEEALVVFGIDKMKHVEGWTARKQDPQSCLVIDEASMVGDRLLSQALKVFDRIILVGDPGQLSPIKDRMVLEEEDGVELQEIHRQAEGSPIIQFAHAIRNATRDQTIDPPPGIESARIFDPANGPVIVWRNATRKSLNTGMRNRLGLPAKELVEGEPLVCKATVKTWAHLGLVNNSLWWYAGNNHVVDDAGKRVHLEHMHIDGIHDRQPELRDCQFQLGYAITAHTAQGSEWDSVQIYVEEVAAFEQANDFEEAKRFLYTAVTRAKQRLVMVHASFVH